VVDKFKFRAENQWVIEAGGRPADGKAILLGHTRGFALDGFIHLGGVVPGNHARAHRSRHQINGKVDYLRGLKENVIMGRLVPAGTGMEYYRQVKIAGEDVIEEPVLEPTLGSTPRIRGGCARPVKYCS